MTKLSIVYDGQTVYDRDVESFSLEANAGGDLFVTASMEMRGPDPDQGGAEVDDRLTPFERSLLTKREANA